MAETKIRELKKGDSTRTAMHTAVMNEIIGKLNNLLSMEVKGQGKFHYSDGNIVLEANGFPPPPSSGTFVLGAIESLVQWIATEECACGVIVDGGNV